LARRNRRKRPGLARTALLVAGLSAAAYFAHHAVYGRYGLNAHSRLTGELEQLSARRAALEDRRDRLASDIRHLRHPPHADLIEEAAREILGYEKPGRLRLTNVPR
jgi:cell division protein FtsB